VTGYVDREKAQAIADGIYGEIYDDPAPIVPFFFTKHKRGLDSLAVEEIRRCPYIKGNRLYKSKKLFHKVTFCTEPSCNHMKSKEICKREAVYINTMGRDFRFWTAYSLQNCDYKEFYIAGSIDTMKIKNGENAVSIEFIQRRIAELVEKKGVSNHQVSRDLGHSNSYIQNIVSGRALPSVQELFAICRYFDIDLQDFFDTGIKNPLMINEIVDRIRSLDDSKLRTIIGILDMLEIKKA